MRAHRGLREMLKNHRGLSIQEKPSPLYLPGLHSCYERRLQIGDFFPQIWQGSRASGEAARKEVLILTGYEFSLVGSL